MGFFKKRAEKEPSYLGLWLSDDRSLPVGYHRLLDSPEVSGCINRIANIISASTIYLMRNTPNGDVRVKDRLSRFVDVTPWPNVATRKVWMSWIVAELLGDGDGNACVLPQVKNGEFCALRPMPAVSLVQDSQTEYVAHWCGRVFEPDDILHFRLHADSLEPWRGRGVRVQAKKLADSLIQTSALKDSLSSPDYKPPLIVAVDSDSDLSDETKREAFRKSFLEDSDKGKPWIIPSHLLSVSQVKPLTLTDLAIKDTMELDKKSVASIFGVPPFMLGIGSYNKDEFDNFIQTVVIPICEGIEQELTAKLLVSEERYFQFNRRRLYAYNMKELVEIDLAMSDRGFMSGDEVREDAGRDPAGLNEFRVLENYIPWDMAALQKKLTQKE